MSRYCKIVVLPEGCNHAALARGYFQGRNVSERFYELQSKWTGRNGNHAAVRRWFCEEISIQARPLSGRRSVLALIDEDGQRLDVRRNEVRDELSSRSLPGINPDQGRCLVIPMRNVETWMVWAARWEAAGCPTSPVSQPGYQPVSELDDYKRFKSPDGNAVPKEALLPAYRLGKIIAKLNPITPPAGIPPALQVVLQPLNNFLDWAKHD
jgi:hypothetical protein